MKPLDQISPNFLEPHYENKGTSNPFPTVYYLVILFNIMNREFHSMRPFLFALTNVYTTARCFLAAFGSGLPSSTRK